MHASCRSLKGTTDASAHSSAKQAQGCDSNKLVVPLPTLFSKAFCRPQRSTQIINHHTPSSTVAATPWRAVARTVELHALHRVREDDQRRDCMHAAVAALLRAERASLL
eukprot:2256256-Pleurochrysis_carterae.AAC.2